jgi:retinol dehydrogenase-14
MQGKVCLVTGANGGLGKATALGLARLGAKVIMASRDQTRGEAARAEVEAAGGKGAELLLLDLADLDSVRRAAEEVRARYGRLDVLINNAAVYKQRRELSRQGYELMFATNHLGPFLLTNLLLDLLKSSEPARVISVAAPSTTKLDFHDLQGELKFGAFSAFGASKMANLLFTYELARRLQGRGVTANVLHPGLVKTALMGEAPAAVRWILNLISTTPEKAAATPVYLASSPDVRGVSGKFFKGQKQISSNAYSQDRDVQHRLWEVSEKLVGLS